MKDAVVVGGGMGGLAAAIALASAGKSVALLEADAGLGGKAGTATVDGVRFDTGPSLLTLPRGIEALFRGAGEDFAQHVQLRTFDQPFRYHWPDRSSLEVSADLDRTLDNVGGAFGADARRELQDFLAYARRIWEAVAPAFVFGSAPTMGSVLRQGPRAWWSALHIDAFRTMDDAVRARVHEPHLRDVLLRYATYNGSDPRRAPATLHCIAHVELGLGGSGVEGGMGALVEALAALARRKGVEIVTGARVVDIAVERERAHGVHLADGRQVAARAVIANMEARALRRMLSGSADDELRDDSPPSMSGWTAVARARRRTHRAPHAVLFPARYEQEFVDIFDHGTVPADPTIYCCAQEPAHGVRGWTDHEPVFVMVNAPSADRVRIDDSFAESIRRRIVQRGLFDETDRFVWQRTPADLARRFPESNGSLYGAASHGWNAAFRRARNRVDGVSGLYLASGSAHPGGGVPLAIQSGCEAARLALLDLPRTA